MANRKLPNRPAPRDCRNEPPFPGRHTVTFHLYGALDGAGPTEVNEFVMHRPVKRCVIECPHFMSECGEFAESSRVG